MLTADIVPPSCRLINCRYLAVEQAWPGSLPAHRAISSLYQLRGRPDQSYRSVGQ
jgi:hypothetical protein